MKPPPKLATSVKVCGSPPSSTTLTIVPSLIFSVSGSKSQLGSGVPAAASAKRLASVVDAPREMFLQKSAPSAALKVAGSHSSRATTCASRGASSCHRESWSGFPCASASMATASVKTPPARQNFTTDVLICDLLLRIQDCAFATARLTGYLGRHHRLLLERQISVATLAEKPASVNARSLQPSPKFSPSLTC